MSMKRRTFCKEKVLYGFLATSTVSSLDSNPLMRFSCAVYIIKSNLFLLVETHSRASQQKIYSG